VCWVTGCLTGRIHNMKRANFAGVVCEQDGKMLLVQEGHKEAYGLWSFPLGCCETDELPEVCAVREAKEETGLYVPTTSLISELVLRNDEFKSTSKFDFAEVHLFLYQARVHDGVLACGEDVLDVRWVEKGNALQLPLRGKWMSDFI